MVRASCRRRASTTIGWALLGGMVGFTTLGDLPSSFAHPCVEQVPPVVATTSSSTPGGVASTLGAAAPASQAKDKPMRGHYEFVGPSGKPKAKDRSDAEREEVKGKALIRKGDCQAALGHLEKAYSLAAREGSLIAAAECHESAGNLVAAHDLVAQLGRAHVTYELKRKKRRIEWLERLKGTTATLEVVTTEPGVLVEVDKAPWKVEGGTPQDGEAVRVLVGEHAISAKKEGFESFNAKVKLEPGENRQFTVTLVPIPPPPKPIDVSEMATAPVTDFCRIKLGTNKSRYQKQRLVTFDLAGARITNAPESEVDAQGKVVGQHHAFEQARLHDHLRTAFFKTFPTPRFYNVKSTAESPDALQRKSFISSEDMIKAAEIDTFGAYSIACADWVAMPRVTSKDAKWLQVEKERIDKQGKKEKYRAWTLNVTWTAEMDVYRRETNGWQLHATIDGSNGGLIGMAFGLAASAQQGSGKKQLPNLSDRPDSKCSVPFVDSLSGIGSGFKACYTSATELEGAIVKAREADKLSIDVKASAVGGSSTLSGALPPNSTGVQAGPTQTGVAGASSMSDVPSAVGAAGAPPTEMTAVPSAVASEVVKATPELGPTAPVKVASKTVDAAKASQVVLSPVQSALRDYRGSISPNNLISLRASGDVKGLEATVQAANHVWDSCNGAVSSIAHAEKELRQLASADLSKLGVNAALGFSACLGIGVSIDLGEATAPGTGELRSNLCKDVKDDVALGRESMAAVSVCQGRTSMEQATLVLQKEAKRLDGWRLFAPLQVANGARSGVFGVALGRDEGASRGDLYVAFEQAADGSKRHVAWGRIVKQGPGGEQGDKDPSHFKFRMGLSPLGTRMDEHAQIGIVLGLRPQFGVFTSTGNLGSSVAIGAALEGGYNASSFVPLADEIWSRIYMSYEAGQQGEKFMSIDLVPEAVYYVGNRLAVFTGGGMGYVSMKRNIPIARADGTSTGSDLSGSNAGIVITGGADYSLSPDWYARASLWYRQGLSNASLKDGDAKIPESAGTLSALRLGLQAGYVF